MSRAADIAYAAIRRQILSGEIAPGSQLKEEELAELCGVSRTPVRDALRRLEAEMLVRRTDTMRSFVPDWSDDEVDEIFALRMVLESEAARRAATRITPQQIDQLRAINDRLGSAMRPDAPTDDEIFVEANREFHALLFEAAQSERLAKMRGLLVEEVIQYRTTRGFDRAGRARSHADHDELICALSERDGEWAAAIMVGHIRRAFHATTAGLSQPMRLESRPVAGLRE